MSGKLTFTMIKPDAVANGNTGKIIDHIIGKGYKIVAMKYTRLVLKKQVSFMLYTASALSLKI